MADEEKPEHSGARPVAGEDSLPRPVGAGATAGAEGCPVEMHDGQPCDRTIHNAPVGVDERPVCLMHSRDPNKDDAAFQAEFERILQEAVGGAADFTGFVFPSAQYVGRDFKRECLFRNATFTQNAIFRDATFRLFADFRGSSFSHEAMFRDATFRLPADFRETTFREAASFMDATFIQHVNFWHASFTQAAIFASATFTHSARFREAQFMGAATFWFAAFRQAADFSEAVFDQGARFEGARFLDAAIFRETRFRNSADIHATPVFSLAQFEKPEVSIFYKTNLGRSLFHDCDVSRVVFSNVEWRKRAENGKASVFEEVIDINDHAAGALRPAEGSPDERNYALIAELYQQLKRNYDAKCDYWTAGDFHYGEMEMKRLSSPRRNKVLRWLHRNAGLVAWYKYASEYGESYVRPVAWLAALVLLFTLLYPLWGLTPGANQGNRMGGGDESLEASTALKISYRTLHEFVAEEQAGWAWGTTRFLGHSLMTTLGVAFFQRDLEYRPAYPRGRALSWLQLLLTYTLVALFLLALRRQFRR